MNKFLNASNLFLKRNSSTILTCVGALGVVATSVMAVKATPKAMALMEEAETVKGEELTVTEKVLVAGPAYIPSVLVGASTIACIFGANALNKRQQASLMSAYALVNNSYKEYKAKVEEICDETTVHHIQEELVNDKFDDIEIEPMHEEEKLFFDDFSMRFFYSTIEEVLEAERRFNQNFMMSGSACLNEFYDILGIGRIDAGYQLGWAARSGNYDLGISEIEFQHQKMIVGDNVECYVISMIELPCEDYMY